MEWEKVLEKLDAELEYIHMLIMEQKNPEGIRTLVDAMDTMTTLKNRVEYITTKGCFYL